MWPLFLGTRPFNWTWSSWTKSKWTFMNNFWWKCSILRVAWLRRFIVTISLLFPSEQQQKQTEIAICSQNCIQILEFAIDFWCLQLTFDVFNWVYSKHMIHYNKVNWKIFAKNFLKIFPIDLQSPIDFSQLHMIRPLVCNVGLPSIHQVNPCTFVAWLKYALKSFLLHSDHFRGGEP